MGSKALESITLEPIGLCFDLRCVASHCSSNIRSRLEKKKMTKNDWSAQCFIICSYTGS